MVDQEIGEVMGINHTILRACGCGNLFAYAAYFRFRLYSNLTTLATLQVSTRFISGFPSMNLDLTSVVLSRTVTLIDL